MFKKTLTDLANFGDDAGFMGVIGARLMPIGECSLRTSGAKRAVLGASQPLHRDIAVVLLNLHPIHVQLPGES